MLQLRNNPITLRNIDKLIFILLQKRFSAIYQDISSVNLLTEFSSEASLQLAEHWNRETREKCKRNVKKK